jgi:hypothetical protein
LFALSYCFAQILINILVSLFIVTNYGYYGKPYYNPLLNMGIYNPVLNNLLSFFGYFTAFLFCFMGFILFLLFFVFAMVKKQNGNID